MLESTLDEFGDPFSDESVRSNGKKSSYSCGPEHSKSKDGELLGMREELLGVQLEEELNHSIEALRKQEKKEIRTTKLISIGSSSLSSTGGQGSSGGTRPSSSAVSGFLEDIDMPSFCSSYGEDCDDSDWKRGEVSRKLSEGLSFNGSRNMTKIGDCSSSSSRRRRGESCHGILEDEEMPSFSSSVEEEEQLIMIKKSTENLRFTLGVWSPVKHEEEPKEDPDDAVKVVEKFLHDLKERIPSFNETVETSMSDQTLYKEAENVVFELENVEEKPETFKRSSSPNSMRVTLGRGFKELEMEELNDSLLASPQKFQQAITKRSFFSTLNAISMLKVDEEEEFLNEAEAIAAQLEMGEDERAEVSLQGKFMDKRFTLGKVKILELGDLDDDELLTSLPSSPSPPSDLQSNKETLGEAVVQLNEKKCENSPNLNTTFDKDKDALRCDELAPPNCPQKASQVLNLTFENIELQAEEKKSLQDQLKRKIVAAKLNSTFDKDDVDPNTTVTIKGNSHGDGSVITSNEVICSTYDKNVMPPAANSTFDQNNVPQAANSTFDQNDVPQAANSTFDQNNVPQAANSTFDQKNAPLSAHCTSDKNTVPQSEANGTFDMDDKPLETKVASVLRETPTKGGLDLMDASQDELDANFYSTPNKGSNFQPINSTPVALSSTVTKDPRKSFLHRLSCNIRNQASSQETADTGSGQEKEPGKEYQEMNEKAAQHQPAILSRLGIVTQGEVASRLLKMRRGPLRSLHGPLKVMHKDSESSSGEGPSCNSAKSSIPSLGSVSSIGTDGEQPGRLFTSTDSPELVFRVASSRGSQVMTSTPSHFNPLLHMPTPCTPIAPPLPNAKVDITPLMPCKEGVVFEEKGAAPSPTATLPAVVNNISPIPVSTASPHRITADGMSSHKKNLGDKEVPLKNLEVQEIPLNTTTDKVVPLNTTMDKVTPLNTKVDKVHPLNTTMDKVPPLNNTAPPLNTTLDKVAPLNITIDKVGPFNTTVDCVAPLDTTVNKATPLNTTVDQIAPLNITVDKIALLSTVDKISSSCCPENKVPSLIADSDSLPFRRTGRKLPLKTTVSASTECLDTVREGVISNVTEPLGTEGNKGIPPCNTGNYVLPSLNSRGDIVAQPVSSLADRVAIGLDSVINHMAQTVSDNVAYPLSTTDHKVPSHSTAGGKSDSSSPNAKVDGLAPDLKVNLGDGELSPFGILVDTIAAPLSTTVESQVSTVPDSRTADVNAVENDGLLPRNNTKDNDSLHPVTTVDNKESLITTVNNTETHMSTEVDSEPSPLSTIVNDAALPGKTSVGAVTLPDNTFVETVGDPAGAREPLTCSNALSQVTVKPLEENSSQVINAVVLSEDCVKKKMSPVCDARRHEVKFLSGKELHEQKPSLPNALAISGMKEEEITHEERNKDLSFVKCEDMITKKKGSGEDEMLKVGDEAKKLKLLGTRESRDERRGNWDIYMNKNEKRTEGDDVEEEVIDVSNKSVNGEDPAKNSCRSYENAPLESTEEHFHAAGNKAMSSKRPQSTTSSSASKLKLSEDLTQTKTLNSKQTKRAVSKLVKVSHPTTFTRSPNIKNNARLAGSSVQSVVRTRLSSVPTVKVPDGNIRSSKIGSTQAIAGLGSTQARSVRLSLRPGSTELRAPVGQTCDQTKVKGAGVGATTSHTEGKPTDVKKLSGSQRPLSTSTQKGKENRPAKISSSVQNPSGLTKSVSSGTKLQEPHRVVLQPRNRTPTTDSNAEKSLKNISGGRKTLISAGYPGKKLGESQNISAKKTPSKTIGQFDLGGIGMQKQKDMAGGTPKKCVSSSMKPVQPSEVVVQSSAVDRVSQPCKASPPPSSTRPSGLKPPQIRTSRIPAPMSRLRPPSSRIAVQSQSK